MKTSLAILSSLMIAALVLASGRTDAQKRVVAYVPNWIDLATFTNTIDYAKLSQINIAFETPIDEPGALSYNRLNDKLIAKAHASHVQVLVSIGGGAAA